MEEILVLSKGGTFDKTYDLLTGNLQFQESFVPSILRLGRSTLKTETQTVFLKDSLDIVDQDRESIANILKQVKPYSTWEVLWLLHRSSTHGFRWR